MRSLICSLRFFSVTSSTCSGFGKVMLGGKLIESPFELVVFRKEVVEFFVHLQ